MALSSPTRQCRFLEEHALDVALVLVAAVFAASSLTYPFGGDQAVHFYVAREWVESGAVPYRDSFDYKTPGIYAIHALLFVVFGAAEWPIRVAELGCVLALGLMCARLAAPKGKPGTRGFAVLATSVVYYGFFSYWDTAQCEIWSVTAAFASIAAARGRTLRGALAAGVLGAVALLMKPVVLPLVVVSALLSVRAGDHREGAATGSSTRRLALFAGAATTLLGVVTLYFVGVGGARAAADVLIGANEQYVVGARRIHSLRDLGLGCADLASWFFPLDGVVTLAIVRLVWLGWARPGRAGERARRTATLGIVLFVASFVAGVVQLKFYRYHFGVMVGPIAYLLTAAYAADVAERAERPARGVPVVAAVVLLVSFCASGTAFVQWRDGVRRAVALASGRIDRLEFVRRHVIWGLRYDLGASEEAALWLRAHAAPGDELAVRPFHAEIYVSSGLRYPGRFFWTLPLTDPGRTYRRDEWLAEDRRVFETRPPRFAIANVVAGRGNAESCEFLVAYGYRRIKQIGELVLFELPRAEERAALLEVAVARVARVARVRSD